MALKYRMPTVGEGTRESPLSPKHPDERGWNPTYFLDGAVEVVIRGTEQPTWASDPEVEFLGEVEEPK
jgi:hypothetical protein